MGSTGPICHAIARRLLATLAGCAFLLPRVGIATEPVADGLAPVQASVTVLGSTLGYLEAGSGPVVVLLHGLAGSADEWRPTIAALAPAHRVIAPDLIGFGRSDKPLIAYRPATLTDFLEAQLEALHVTHATIVGNSLGGWIAARLALQRPDLVDRLVLVDSAGLASLPRSAGTRTMEALRLASSEDFQWVTRLAFYDQSVATRPAAFAALSARIAAGDGYAIDRLVDAILRGADTLDRDLPRLRQPTLIVWGGADRLVPLDQALRFQHAIRGSRSVVLEHCGHMPQIECPEALNARIIEFLEH